MTDFPVAKHSSRFSFVILELSEHLVIPNAMKVKNKHTPQIDVNASAQFIHSPQPA